MNQSRIYKPDGAMQGQINETEQPQPKPFPLHCFPKAVRDMGEAICQAEHIPGSLAGCCLLGAVSATVGAGLEVKSGPTRLTRATLFIMASGESGSGKSQAYRHAVQPMLDFENELAETFRRERLPSLLAEKELLESEIAALKRKNVSGPVERKEACEQIEHKRRALMEIENQLQTPILTVEDITPEALAVGLAAAHHECLTSLSADAGEIINNLMGRYNKLDRTDDGIYVKSWSGDQFKQNRIGRPPIILKRPSLSALWLVQKDKVDTILSDRTLTEGGAIPRLLICHTNCQPRHIQDDNTGIPEDVTAAYGALIRDLLRTLRLAPAPTTIAPAPEALSAMNRHYNAIVDRWHSGEIRDVTSYAVRWTEQAWRIAVCLHAATYGDQAGGYTLSLETARAAIEIADWFSDQQLAILATGRAERRLARARHLERLVMESGGEVTLRILEKSNGFSNNEVESLAAEFPQLFQIDTRQNPKGGPSSRVLVLPNH